MDWVLEDWEYTNDEIYALERQKDIEKSWQKYEETVKFKIINKTNNDINTASSKVRGVDQKVI